MHTNTLSHVLLISKLMPQLEAAAAAPLGRLASTFAMSLGSSVDLGKVTPVWCFIARA